MKPPITDFHAPGCTFLSNFYPFQCTLPNDPRQYPSTEHAYQAAKFANGVMRDSICMCKTPGRAKRKARECEHLVRKDWDRVKLHVMGALLVQKFQPAHMRKMLDATKGRDLIEGNTWGDRFWGCVEVNGEWVGQNWLGKILMEIRDK